MPEPKTELYYKRVFIKSEDDLPKEKGHYPTHHSKSEMTMPTGLMFFLPENTHSIKEWMSGDIDWYLQPLPDPLNEQGKEEKPNLHFFRTNILLHLNNEEMLILRDWLNGYINSWPIQSAEQPEPSKQGRTAEDWLKKQAIDPDRVVFCENGVTAVKLSRLLEEYRREGLPTEKVLYGFYYNPCIHESAFALMSLHQTRKGAEMAMEFHKVEAKREWEKLYKDTPMEFITPFGQFESWSIEEVKVQNGY